MARPEQPPKRPESCAFHPGLLLLWGFTTLTSLALNLATLLPPLCKPKTAHRAHDKDPMAPAKEIEALPTCGSLKDPVINLDHGDPTMFEPFWRKMGDRATVIIPGWQAMSYFSDPNSDCWFMEPDFDVEIRRLHRLVGNAVTDGRIIIVGTGSSQLFQAALYALSPSDASQRMDVVSALPYYSAYPAATDCLKSSLFRWAGDVKTCKGNKYIELICSPNNPDGSTRTALLNSEGGKRIHDLAYYWPQYTPITYPADHDIMLFTVSKATGHAGTRLGWAIVKDREVAKRMIKFIELNTIGVSKDSQIRAAKILKVISDGYEFPEVGDTDRFFNYGRCLMTGRWERLREAIKKAGIFSLPEFPSGTCKFTGERTSTNPAFAWLKCEKDGVEDCASFLKSYNILTRSGKHFGMEPTFTRVSMLDRDETFNVLIKRLWSMA